MPWIMMLVTQCTMVIDTMVIVVLSLLDSLDIKDHDLATDNLFSSERKEDNLDSNGNSWFWQVMLSATHPIKERHF